MRNEVNSETEEDRVASGYHAWNQATRITCETRKPIRRTFLRRRSQPSTSCAQWTVTISCQFPKIFFLLVANGEFELIIW